MISFSREFEFVGGLRTWFVGILFLTIGILCGVVIPHLLDTDASVGSLQVSGKVVRIDSVEDMLRPVFRFVGPDGKEREFAASLLSNRTHYRLQDPVVVVLDPAHTDNPYVMNDQDTASAIWILRALGLVFGSIGVAVIGMKFLKLSDAQISKIAGLMGALCAAIPSALALPGLWLAYTHRPNLMFDRDALFGSEQWILGSVFTIVGLLTLVGLVWLLRNR